MFRNLLGFLLILMVLIPNAQAGHYRLVYWRERGLNENAGCGGHHVINVFVWDQGGGFLGNKQIRTTWGVTQATTDWEGYAQFVIDQYADRDLIIHDPPHTSDASPLFSVAHYPCYGHYSYEAGFMLVNSADDLAIDTSTCGTLNTSGSTNSDAPHTRSLIYNSINCLDRSSDPFTWGTWSASFAQTFRVPDDVNRILGVQVHMTLGGGKVDYGIEIREDSPTGRVVYSMNIPYAYNDNPWLTRFSLNACPVEPGRTYAMRFHRTNGLNAFHVTQDVYGNGQYYANDLPNSNRELMGFVIGGRQGNIGPVSTPTNTPIPTNTRTPTFTWTPTQTLTPTIGMTSTPTPIGPDFDGDGIADVLEGGKNAGLIGKSNMYLHDSDGDGLYDGIEDLNRNGTIDSGETSPIDTDSDNDGYEDGIEVLILASNPLNPNSPVTPFADADGDLLPDSLDPAPSNPDSDGDRFLDGYEAAMLGMAAVSNATQKPLLGDVDHNGFRDNADAQKTLNFFANVAQVAFDSSQSDVNRDVVIDNADAQRMLMFFANITPCYPIR